MADGDSINRKKWWHGTLLIRDRQTNLIKSILSTVDLISPIPQLNNDTTIKAFSSSEVANCKNLCPIPVPAFNPVYSAGYFVFFPTPQAVADSIVDINNYQEAINLSNRRVFEFIRRAAYNIIDSSCSANSPNYVDNYIYETIINNQSSNVFRYKEIAKISQIGCCNLEVDVPSEDLPLPSLPGRKTRLWYLVYDELIADPNLRYRIFSYDFALLSNQLVDRGKIDLSLLGSNLKLHDVTWIHPINQSGSSEMNENILIALDSEGDIRQIFPGNSMTVAKIGDPIAYIGNKMDIDASNESFKFSMEFNYFENTIVVFGADTNGQPALWKLNYQNYKLSVLKKALFNNLSINSIGEFAFDSSSQQNLAYCIINNNLAVLQMQDSLFGTNSFVNMSGLLNSFVTVNFAENPDTNIQENILYGSTSLGQQFQVNRTTGVSSIISGARLGTGIVKGSTTTLAGEDVRVSPFPFYVGLSPWLFMIDTSGSMAGDKLGRIKDRLLYFLNNYVRKNDKITLLVFNENYKMITKNLVTYNDVTELTNFIELNLISGSNVTNFCSSLSNISQYFTDLRNVVILSDGTFDDCGENWQSSINSSINSILVTNPRVIFRSVGVSATDSQKLQYISSFSNGGYYTWNKP